MIFDLHIHESTFSSDSEVSLLDIIKEAKRKGLDGICITDHDNNDIRLVAHELSEQYKIPIIVGTEVLTYEGDVLIFGVHELPPKKVSSQELVDWVRERGGITISAHPYRKNNRGLEDNLFKISGLHAIEGMNGRTPLKENLQAQAVARKLNLPISGGSDAHTIDEVGQMATRFQSLIKTEFDFVEAIKSKLFEPVVYDDGEYVSLEEFEEERTA